jgi:phage/plasmid-associated DNA primase
VICPFDARFSGANEDKRIEEKLLPELPGILNMCLEAYERMRKRKSLFKSEIVAQKLQEYKEDVDIVRRWYKDNLELLPEINGKYTTCKQIYGKYNMDMSLENERPLTSGSFFKRLSKIIPDYTERRDLISESGEKLKILRGVLMHDGSNY